MHSELVRIILMTNKTCNQNRSVRTTIMSDVPTILNTSLLQVYGTTMPISSF